METDLNANISNDDNSFKVPGNNLFRADHPSNTKQGDVCIYYRNSLRLKGIQYLLQYLLQNVKRKPKRASVRL